MNVASRCRPLRSEAAAWVWTASGPVRVLRLRKRHRDYLVFDAYGMGAMVSGLSDTNKAKGAVCLPLYLYITDTKSTP